MIDFTREVRSELHKAIGDFGDHLESEVTKEEENIQVIIQQLSTIREEVSSMKLESSSERDNVVALRSELNILTNELVSLRRNQPFVEKSGGPFICDKCGSVCESLNKLEEHMKSTVRRYLSCVRSVVLCIRICMK